MADSASNIYTLNPNLKSFGSGGSGGGSSGDGFGPFKHYVDAQDEKTRAQNDARFAEVLSRFDSFSSRLDSLTSKVDHLPRPPGFWQIAGLIASALVAGLTLLGVFSDRFDSGISALGLLDRYSSEQKVRDEAQDAAVSGINGKLDRLLEAASAANPSNTATGTP